MSGWGPAHQQPSRRRNRWATTIVALTVLAFALQAAAKSIGELYASLIWWAILAAVLVGPKRWRRLLARITNRVRAGAAARPRLNPPTAADVLSEVRQRGWQAGGGIYLGHTERRESRHSRAERAALILGPPRAGKTSAVIIPSLIAHWGPAVSTSTKTDVLAATSRVRGTGATCWVFDPTGSSTHPPGRVMELRWSPVTAAAAWDGALLTARAMTARVGAGATDRTHWASRAQALLASLLHAAAIHGKDMETVVGWVMRHDIDEAGVLLEDERCAERAFSTLVGIHNTEARERSSIFSATADALEAYTADAAINATRDPNFDADRFVRSGDTIYVHAPAEDQAAAAPIVCGLLSEIRRATYRAHARGELTHGRVLFALDEAANIAPLEELPQIASEGGGQGLVLLAAFQDLSQARARWGAQADGFLTLFGSKLLLPGIADARTLESVSQMLGEYDRQVVARSEPDRAFNGTLTGNRSTTYSTQRTRVLSPGEIANIPAGHALYLDGVRWELLTLTPAHQTEPWRTLTTPAR